MSHEDKISKLVKKMRRSMKDVRFADLVKVLEAIGYTCIKRNGGSHNTFRKKNSSLIITIPKVNPVNPTYVRIVLEAYDISQS